MVILESVAAQEMPILKLTVEYMIRKYGRPEAGEIFNILLTDGIINVIMHQDGKFEVQVKTDYFEALPLPVKLFLPEGEN